MNLTTDTKSHWAAKMHAEEYRKGQLDRREFLTRATMLGVSASAAYGLVGTDMHIAFEHHHYKWVWAT